MNNVKLIIIVKTAMLNVVVSSRLKMYPNIKPILKGKRIIEFIRR